ncbi:MAG: hypothetical protein ABIF09_05315 [Gemmatimonadota bacterium]
MSRLRFPYLPMFLSCALGVAFGPASAQEGEAPTPEEVRAAESAPLFSSHEILELTLEADFHTMRREDRKEEDSEERPAGMQWRNADGSTGSQEIQLQTRGNFRLARRNCDFPPLRLNVKTEPSKGTLFEGQDKLKLVGICKVSQDYWEQYVLAEYLVYRMFNLFTPTSFRVRLARVTYIDSSGEDETFTRYGFLIEDDDAMATRNGGWKVAWEPGPQFNPVLLERDQAILVDVFQYMLGNTDWSGVEMHNMELMLTPPNTPFIVPFDFDFSGIVNARYANPDESLSIRSVRERLFRGFCPDQVNRQPEDYAAVYEEFRQKKEEIYGLWRNQADMDEDRLKDTLEYLDEFYEILADPRQIQTRMINQCRRIGEP